MTHQKITFRRSRTLGSTAALLAVGLVLTGCAGGGEEGSGSDGGSKDIVNGGTMTIGVTGTSIGSLDPALANTLVSVSVLGTLCDGFYDEQPDGTLVSTLAEGEPEWNEDHTAATITFRDGVKYTNGDAVTAEDMVAVIERNKTVDGSQRVGDLKIVESAEAVDSRTLRLTFTGPLSEGGFSDLMTNRGMIPYSPAAAEEMGSGFAASPVCVGGFTLDTQTTDTVRLVRETGETYFEPDAIHLDAIEFKIVADPSVRFTNLQSGEFDAIQSISPKDLAAAEGNASIEVFQFPGRGYHYLSVNTETLSDPLVRQALAHSIDREAISNTVYGGAFAPACSFIAPESPLATPENQECLAYDPERAEELLEQAGASTPIAVTLEYPSSPEFNQMATLVQATAKETGFDIQLKPTDTAANLANTEAGLNDLSIGQWTGSADPTRNIMLTPAAFLNSRKWDDPGMNELVAQLEQTADPEEQKGLLGEVMTLINEEVPNIYLVHNALVHGAQSNVAGLDFSPSSSLFAMRAGFTS